MKNYILMICFLELALFAACTGRPESSTTLNQTSETFETSPGPHAQENSNLKQKAAVHNDEYIVFSEGYDFYGVYKYKNSDEFSEYANETSILKPLGDDYFVELDGSILVRGAGTSPDPHGIYFHDLSNGENLLPGDYLFGTDGWNESPDRRIILREIGTSVPDEQKGEIDLAQYQKEKEREEKYPGPFGGLMYYDELAFVLSTRELKRLGIVYTRLLQ